VRTWLDHLAAAVQAMPPTNCLSITTVSVGSEVMAFDVGPLPPSGSEFTAFASRLASYHAAGGYPAPNDAHIVRRYSGASAFLNYLSLRRVDSRTADQSS
jgi:hypothetical protein